MFRKKCPECGKKISKDFEFCPYCGCNIKRYENEKNYGFLGKDDFLPDFEMKMPFGLSRVFNTLMKQLDKQFKELDKELGTVEKIERKGKKARVKSTGISISISTGTGKKPEIKVRGIGPGIEIKQTAPKIEPAKKITKTTMPEAKVRKLVKLPKTEAETKVRRLSNKIIYEINLPGVKSLSDIIINQLENSIEIKAFSKDKAYFKLLPIKLPILNYKLEKEKLILELKANE